MNYPYGLVNLDKFAIDKIVKTCGDDSFTGRYSACNFSQPIISTADRDRQPACNQFAVFLFGHIDIFTRLSFPDESNGYCGKKKD